MNVRNLIPVNGEVDDYGSAIGISLDKNILSEIESVDGRYVTRSLLS